MMLMIAGALLMAGSCRRQVTSESAQDRSIYTVENTITDTLFFISRGHCFGRCPVYEALIYNNGIVIYKGIENVEKKGLHHSKLSQAQLDALLDSILQMDYFNLPDTFPTSNLRIADLPTTYTMAQINEKRLVIVNRNFESDNSAATFDRWRQLLGLEDFVDSLVNSLTFQPIEQLKTDE